MYIAESRVFACLSQRLLQASQNFKFIFLFCLSILDFSSMHLYWRDLWREISTFSCGSQLCDVAFSSEERGVQLQLVIFLVGARILFVFLSCFFRLLFIQFFVHLLHLYQQFKIMHFHYRIYKFMRKIIKRVLHVRK